MDRTKRRIGAGRIFALAVLLGPVASAAGQVVRSIPSPSDVSDILRAPGSDPYATPIDWASIPPWRQTSFFGVRAEGTVFVFVVDCSGSMGQGDRMTRAKRELRRAIGKLQFPQRYLIIFYNDRPIPMPGGIPESAGTSEKAATRAWLQMVEPEGDTDPRSAMRMAVGFRPSAVYLLSDGEFPEGTAESIAEFNRKKVPIHAIDLSGGATGGDLAEIAEQSGGTYHAAGDSDR